jgi:hypothetical protein
VKENLRTNEKGPSIYKTSAPKGGGGSAKSGQEWTWGEGVIVEALTGIFCSIHQDNGVHFTRRIFGRRID